MEKIIKLKYLAKIQSATIKEFAALDEDYPDYRVVSIHSRTINYWLDKITKNITEQAEILEIIKKNNFNFNDLSFKPICDELRKLGYTIKEGK